MFTITLKGKPDKNRPDFAKITMVIYRPGYNRVPKILPVTGLYKHWDQSQQRFKPKTENAAANNALLASTVNKYLQVGNAWDDQQVRWTPKELSHYYDKPREVMLRETVVPTVEQVYRKWIGDIRETKKMKNGHEVPCEAYAKANERILDFLTRFVKEKYDRAFSNLEFTDITEQFLKDYVFYIESEGAKKGNRGGLRGKLHSLYQVVKKAEKKGIPGADVDAFVCTNEKFREQEHEPSTISLTLLKAMESMDRSLISEKESYYLDLFLFCFYCGGIAPIDAAYLTWPCIDMKKRKITYERIKTPKKRKTSIRAPRRKNRGQIQGPMLCGLCSADLRKTARHAREKEKPNGLYVRFGQCRPAAYRGHSGVRRRDYMVFGTRYLHHHDGR